MSAECYRVEGLLPNEGSGVANYEIIKAALEKCLFEKTGKMIFPEGEFEVYNEKALELYGELLTGSLSATDYDRMNAERNVLFDVSGANGFEISGEGAGTVFKFNGLIAPFDFHNCNGITIKNITVDWITPPFTEVVVKAVKDDRVYVTPCDGYRLVGGEPIVSTINIVTETGIQGGMAMYSDISNVTTEAESSLFSFTCPEPEIVTPGETLILRHIYAFAPAIHFYLSSNISLENVTLCAVSGMGLICQKSRDITVKGCTVKPSGKRKMSVNCDATHFIGCGGKIEITDCYFEAMGDDVINVHTFYLVMERIEGNKIYARQYANSQDGIPYIPTVGAVIKFANGKTLKPYAAATVASAVYNSEEKLCLIETVEDMSKSINTGDCLYDTSGFATLYFANCVANNIRGRGVLFSSDGALIENNEFKNCTCEGVLLPCGAKPWWEGVPAKNAVIRNNTMLNCGKAPEKYCSSCGISLRHELDTDVDDIFENITITDNNISGEIRPMYITSVKNITIK